MQRDPFGNLMEWGTVLKTLEELASDNCLSECQAGLIRILRFKGNWRLREEVLSHLYQVKTPTQELISEVLSILADDNVYYDARILAGEALIDLLNLAHSGHADGIAWEAQKVVRKLMQTIHPPFFNDALNRLHEGILAPHALDN